MVVTEVTGNNVSILMSHQTAAVLSVAAMGLISTLDPEEHALLAEQVNKDFRMEVGAMDVIAALISTERTLHTVLADLLKMILGMTQGQEVGGEEGRKSSTKTTVN